MKCSIALALCVLFCGCASSNAHQRALCADLTSCHQLGAVVVIGDTGPAVQLLQQAQAGATRFEQHFGVPAPTVAIVTGGVVSAQLEQDIQSAGIQAILPWISAQDQKKLLEASIRKQVLAQTSGLSVEQQEAMVQQALQSAGEQTSASLSQADNVQRGALTHELGHVWFKTVFEAAGQVLPKPGEQYGSGAPDWLDEVAAVLLENETLRQSRREALLQIGASQLYALEQYLSMPHPSFAAARTLAARFGASEDAGNRAIVLTEEEAAQFLSDSEAGDPTVYYTQTQAFIDFVSTYTSHARVFADIADAMAGGATFAEWLEGQSTLPRSLPGLTDAWQAWLDARAKQRS
ncbi:MAG: hypothetical protein AAFO81_12010 [Pseudomonadota bacterium]